MASPDRAQFQTCQARLGVVLIELLRFIPRNLLSWFIGKLAHLEHPRFLVPVVIRWFIKRYKIDCTDVLEDIDSFPSLGAFFVRELKPGARPLGSGVLSPVDGRVTENGVIDAGKMIQVKGRDYSVFDLLSNEEDAESFAKGGYYLTVYLAPPDYHCIHSPVSGSVSKMTYVPGSLWPVNDWSVSSIDNLFPRNERVITFIESEVGRVAVVKVGATNVGAIALTYDKLVSNSAPPVFRDRREKIERSYSDLDISAGDKLGEFRLGSTVILLFEPKAIELLPLPDDGRVRVGQTIATPVSS